MALFRGLADDLPLEEWLNNYIFPAESRLNGDFVYWGTKLAVAEMLLSGTTTFTDMYLFADHVARAAAETGIRALVGEVLYDFPSPNYGPPEAGLKFSEDLCRAWQDHPLVRVAIQPHAVYTCSPELLEQCGELAEKYDTRLIMHLSETAKEVQDCQRLHGATPIGHLYRLGLLNHRLVADHAVALSVADLMLLGASKAGVAHCPESNMKLAAGIAPVAELLRREVAVGLGTDGCASNNNLDMLSELDTAAKLAKVRELNPTVLPAREALGLAGGQFQGGGRRQDGGVHAVHLLELGGGIHLLDEIQIVVGGAAVRPQAHRHFPAQQLRHRGDPGSQLHVGLRAVGHPAPTGRQEHEVGDAQDHRMVRHQPVVEEAQAIEVSHRRGPVTPLAVSYFLRSFGQMDNQAGVILFRQLPTLQ